MDGCQRIAAERQRQMDLEGFSAVHDSEHGCGELSGAGAAYALAAFRQISTGFPGAAMSTPFNSWLWSSEWWKPSIDPIRNLEKAGALIAAEIDRLTTENGG